MCAVGESEEEGDAYTSSVDGAVAPALERGYQSKDEQQNGKGACALDPHSFDLSMSLALNEPR
jgi:hypothetical protein